MIGAGCGNAVSAPALPPFHVVSQGFVSFDFRVGN